MRCSRCLPTERTPFSDGEFGVYLKGKHDVSFRMRFACMVLRTAVVAGLLGLATVASAFPQHIAVTAPTHLKIMRNGQLSGSITLAVGTVLDVEGVDGDFVLVHIHQLKGRILAKDTNFMALSSAPQDAPPQHATPALKESTQPPSQSAATHAPSPQAEKPRTVATTTITWKEEPNTGWSALSVMALGWAMFGTTFLFMIAFMVLMIVAHWRIYAKAGKPGWASLVPIYNSLVYLQIAGKPLWWLVLYFVPLVNIVVAIMSVFAFARKFGKGKGFALGMVFLPFVFVPILAFSDAQYVG
jgi:hypothetical protein